MVFTIFSKGNNFHSFLFASLSKRWSTVIRLGSWQVLLFCSECNKGFAHMGLHPTGKQTGSHQTCSIYVKMVENMEVLPM